MKSFSFDIFDTCLVRSCGQPAIVFDLLAYRVLGNNDTVSHYIEFARIRREAETKARMSSAREEVTLDEIYSFCDFNGLTLTENEAIAVEEMKLEKELLYPVKKMLDKITGLHNQGISVAFISDMYLPESFILELLCLHGFWKEGDTLYLSSSWGKTKHSGTLYNCVVHPAKRTRQWHHYGDNIYSDFGVALRKGIIPHRVRYSFIKSEVSLIKTEFSPFFCVNQIMAGMSRAIRLGEGYNNAQTEFAIEYIAPLYTSFVWKILEGAQKRNITQLFFLARDGYLLYKIAEKYIDHFPDIKIEYIYVSRKVLYFPGLGKLDCDSFLAFLQLRGEESLREIFEKAGIEIEQIPDIDILKEINPERSLSLVESERILRKAFECIDFVKYMQNIKEEQRRRLIAYWQQVGLATCTSTSGIVDLRGTRKSHVIINRILSDSHHNSVFGYYLEVMKNRVDWKPADDYFALLFEERYSINIHLGSIAEISGILEQYFSITTQGRTEAYQWDANKKVIPIFGMKENERLAKGISYLHEHLVGLYTDMYIKNRLYLYNDKVIDVAIKKLAAFAHSPRYSYLKFLRTIYFSNGNYTYRPIVTRLTFKDMFYLIFNRKKLIQRFEWIRGTLILSFPFLRRPIIAMLDMNLVKKLINRLKA